MTALRKTIAPAVLVLMAFALAAQKPLSAEDLPRDVQKAPADIASFLNSIGKKVSGFKTLKTDFTQEKEMVLFKDKIVLQGRIYLQKPGKIAWHVDAPLRYSVLITPAAIRQWDEDTNKVREISLANNPVFQSVIGQMTVWFSGEYGSLLENNEVKVLSLDPIVIECVPRENNIAGKVIKSITITFRDDETYLKQIRIQELTGDVTTLNFTNTLINVPLDNSSFEVKRHV